MKSKMYNYNKKHKKSNQTVNLDIEQLSTELIKPKKQFSNKDSAKKRGRRR